MKIKNNNYKIKIKFQIIKMIRIQIKKKKIQTLLKMYNIKKNNKKIKVSKYNINIIKKNIFKMNSLKNIKRDLIFLNVMQDLEYWLFLLVNF